MQNKTANRWLDVQIVILTIAMTASLFLWNLFAGGNNSTSSGNQASAQEVPATIAQVQPRVHILLGGSAPQIQSQSPSSRPAPVTITGSSR